MGRTVERAGGRRRGRIGTKVRQGSPNKKKVKVQEESKTVTPRPRRKTGERRVWECRTGERGPVTLRCLQ